MTDSLEQLISTINKDIFFPKLNNCLDPAWAPMVY
jgi:hypothetical protein